MVLSLVLVPAAWGAPAKPLRLKLPIPKAGSANAAVATIKVRPTRKAPRPKLSIGALPRGLAAVAGITKVRKGTYRVMLVALRPRAAKARAAQDQIVNEDGSITLIIRNIPHNGGPSTPKIVVDVWVIRGRRLPPGDCAVLNRSPAAPFAAGAVTRSNTPGLSAQDLKLLGGEAAGAVCGDPPDDRILTQEGFRDPPVEPPPPTEQPPGQEPPPQEPPAAQSKPVCSDGIGNDGDGEIDHISQNAALPDPGCLSADDASEADEIAGRPPGCNFIAEFNKNNATTLALLGTCTGVFEYWLRVAQKVTGTPFASPNGWSGRVHRDFAIFAGPDANGFAGDAAVDSTLTAGQSAFVTVFRRASPTAPIDAYELTETVSCVNC